MAHFRMWDPRKNDDYKFIDGVVQEVFEIGGTSVYVHKYLGPKDTSDGSDATLPNFSNGSNELDIQDLLFLENRDRNYDPDIFELTCVYNISDTEFDLRQFGLFLEAGTVFLEFHLNDSIKRLGRKIMAGDVFELPHMRDDALLGDDTPAVNKYYVVEDVNRAASGYSPTWYPHILRVKVKPLTDSQEFSDILDKPLLDGNGDPIEDTTLGDIISDFKDKTDINNAIVEQAENEVDRRNFETQHFYIVPGDECNTQYPWVFAGDGIPPNGIELSGSGRTFPEFFDEGDWFLRTDFEPNVLFKREGNAWRRKETNYRKKWSAAHRLLESFINNNNTTTIQGDTFAEKQPISKAIKPRADF